MAVKYKDGGGFYPNIEIAAAKTNTPYTRKPDYLATVILITPHDYYV